MRSTPTLEALVYSIDELRPLSAVASRVLSLAAGDRFSAHELATLIASDQALSAKLLRLANSAYYGFPRRITTVRDAVVLLGFRAVRSAALATCLVDALPGSNMLRYREFWQFSVSVGMAAELLARSEGTHQDDAFTAGVLHGIGRLALDQYAPEVFAAAVERSRMQGAPLTRAERELLGFSSADLGGALATHWNFPPALVEAVAGHELNPAQLPDRRSLTAHVVRARLLVRSTGIGDGLSEGEPTTPPAEWEEPPLSVALARQGGAAGLAERASAFFETAAGI